MASASGARGAGSGSLQLLNTLTQACGGAGGNLERKGQEQRLGSSVPLHLFSSPQQRKAPRTSVCDMG